MRRCLGCLALLVAIVLAGCGSSSSGSSNPLGTELSYYPSDAPFVLSVATDPNSSAIKGAHALVAHFPIVAFGESAAQAKLSQIGIDYQKDIRPLLGNPIMFGLTGTQVSSGSGARSFLAVWMTKDQAKLSSLIKRIPNIHSSGTHDGATIYQGSGSGALAVDGPTAVLAPSVGALNAALDRHAHGGGITTSQYARAFADLPQGALIETFGNLAGVLARPTAVKARRVPWVAALRGYAASISASSSGLSFKYRLDTSGRPLTAAEVPLSTASPPSLAGALPIEVGIKDPNHIISFVESAEQQSSPASYAKFLRRQAAARAKTGTDLGSLLKLTTGSLIVASDTRTTMGRVGVSNPATASKTLAKLLRDPRALSADATSARSLGGGFYALKRHRQAITLGVASGQLLVGKASPAQLRAFAAAPTTPAAGAQGSVAFRVALVDVLRIALKQAPPQIVQNVLSSLGDITGWVAATPSALTGSATLAVH